MGTQNVQTKSNMVKTTSGSGCANINNINNPKSINIFGNVPNYDSSGRISPSRFNIGKNVTQMSTSMFEVTSLANGIDPNRYFNTGYDLHDLYPTDNYVKSFSNKVSGWQKFANIMGGILTVGSLVGVGFGLFQGVKSLFGKSSDSKSEQSAVSEKDVKSMSLADLKKEETDLETSLSSNQDLQSNYYTRIQEQQTKVSEKLTAVDTAKANYNEKQGLTKTAESERDAQAEIYNQKTDAVNAKSDEIKSLGSSISSLESQIAGAQDETQKGNLQTKLNEMKNQKATLESQLSKLKEEQSAQAKICTQKEKDVKNAKAEEEKAYKQISKAVDELSVEEAKLSNMKAQKESLPDTISQQQKRLSDIQNQLGKKSAEVMNN